MRQGTELVLGCSTALRGHDLSKLQLADLTAIDGQPLAQQLAPALLLHAGDTFIVRPYFVKNRQQANAGTIQVTVPEDDVLNPALWLHLLLAASFECCMPLSNFLFRPTNPSCTAFIETAVSSSGINADVKAVMAMGNTRGSHSAHCMRRCALIHAHEQGASTEQLLDMALISAQLKY